MRRIRCILILICLIFLLCPDKWIKITQKIFFPEKIIHVFMDEASYAAFQQMIYLFQLPDDDMKIVWWKRFSKQEDRLKVHNHNIILPKTPEKLNITLSVLHQTYPHAKFDFHTNYSHIGGNALRAISEIPIHRVRYLHVYEDSALQLYQKRYSLVHNKQNIRQSVIKITKSIQDKNPEYYFPYLNTLPYVYPTIFHVSYMDKLKQNPAYNQLFTIPNLIWQSFDLQNEIKNLSPDIKNKIFDMLGFDIQSVLNQLDGHPMGVLLLSVQDNPDKPDEKRKKLYQIVQENAKKQGTVWFVKNHPINKNYKPFDNLHLIENHIPFEILLLADLPIRYVAGDGSSAYFSLNPNKNEIIAYIPWKNFYFQTLLELGILKESKIIK